MVFDTAQLGQSEVVLLFKEDYISSRCPSLLFFTRWNMINVDE